MPRQPKETNEKQSTPLYWENTKPDEEEDLPSKNRPYRVYYED
jgi:hypothetical protein